MKNRNCPDKDACWDYKASNCEGCAIGEKIARLVRQNKKLKAENANLRHRAEVAERALLFLCDNIMSDISVMVFPSTKTQVQNKQELYDYCIKQAEKKIAEGMEDD